MTRISHRLLLDKRTYNKTGAKFKYLETIIEENGKLDKEAERQVGLVILETNLPDCSGVLQILLSRSIKPVKGTGARADRASETWKYIERKRKKKRERDICVCGRTS